MGTLILNVASTMILFLQLSLLVTFSGCGQTRQMKNISENGFGPALMKMMEGHLPMSPIMFKEGTDCSNCDNCKPEHCPKCWWCNFFGCGVNENCIATTARIAKRVLCATNSVATLIFTAAPLMDM